MYYMSKYFIFNVITCPCETKSLNSCEAAHLFSAITIKVIPADVLRQHWSFNFILCTVAVGNVPTSVLFYCSVEI